MTDQNVPVGAKEDSVKYPSQSRKDSIKSNLTESRGRSRQVRSGTANAAGNRAGKRESIARNSIINSRSQSRSNSRDDSGFPNNDTDISSGRHYLKIVTDLFS